MRELLSVEEYVSELVSLVEPDARTETLSLTLALGRVLAADVRSATAVPVFDNSAMDGYAVRWADVAAKPVRLRVVGDVPAGSDADPYAGPGQTVRIMTGAALPSFADTVVPVEQTRGDGDVIVVLEPPLPGAHVRHAGEDVAAGEVVARAGTTVTPGIAGAVAAAGQTDVAVRRRPVVAVCVTGDELVRGGGALARGQIYESNGPAVGATLVRLGAEVVRTDLCEDRAESLVAWLDEAAPDSDLVVLTGGASVGAYDVVRDVMSGAGGLFRHVRVQPGKPQGWGHWAGTPVACLPGNPVSAVISTDLFVRPMLDRLLGRPSGAWLTGVAGAAWRSPAGRRQVVPVTLCTDDAGRLVATPAHRGGSGSHLVTSLALADGYAVVAEETTEVAPGDLLGVRWL
ncbi:MAG TPA: gephyrin-like molybdotransferase Glp [Propionibacteriaceae bacterium]|nr:gephyrin-like molybdotransferase Glp [Propionibacteriaceae bacterium]